MANFHSKQLQTVRLPAVKDVFFFAAIKDNFTQQLQFFLQRIWEVTARHLLLPHAGVKMVLLFRTWNQTCQFSHQISSFMILHKFVHNTWSGGPCRQDETLKLWSLERHSCSEPTTRSTQLTDCAVVNALGRAGRPTEENGQCICKYMIVMFIPIVVAPHFAFLHFVHFEAKIMSVFFREVSVNTGVKSVNAPPSKTNARFLVQARSSERKKSDQAWIGGQTAMSRKKC